MKTYKTDITITAETAAEANDKLRALATLGRKLKPHELAAIADVVENQPIKLALAKKALGI